MSKKEIIFQNYLYNSKQYKINIKKTKKILSALIIDLKRSEIPLLDSYKENCHFDFTNQLINKYSKYKNIIIFGMGGSILGAKSIFSFFKKKIKKKVFFFDNLDLNLFKEYQEVKNLKNSCFIVVSKSGETLETITNLGATFSKKLFKGKMVFITEIKDNVLLELADRYKADLIEHKEFISGRYSVLSESAMFPAALMGVKYKKFHNLTKLINNKNFIKSLIQNVATIYTLNSRGINNSVILNYDFSLNDLGYWYQQLVAESLGKKRKGINPTLSFGPKDHHSLLQLYLDGPKDKFFTFFNFLKYEKKIKFCFFLQR